MKNSHNNDKQIFKKILAIVAVAAMVCCTVSPISTNAAAVISSSSSNIEVAPGSETSNETAAESETTVQNETSDETGKTEEQTSTSDNSNVSAEEQTEDVQTTSENDEESITKEFVKDNDYTVTATYGKDADLPDDVELKVTEITNKDEIADYTQQAEEALEDAAISTARFFDITFISNNEEVEPKSDVKIKIDLNDSLVVEEGQEVKAVHFDESQAEKPEEAVPTVLVTDTTKDENGDINTVDFTQDSFSITGLIVTDKDRDGWPKEKGAYVVILKGTDDKYYAVDNEGYTLEVEYTPESGVVKFPFPDKVTKIGNYFWNYDYESQDNEEITNRTLNSGSVYLNPDANGSRCVSTEEKALYLVNGKLKGDQNYLVAHSTYLSGMAQEYYGSDVYFANSFKLGEEPAYSGGSSGSDEDPLDAPEVSKSISDEETSNGTYDITLSIKGKAKAVSEKTKADVVILFDESNSMEWDADKDGKLNEQKDPKRLAQSKEALNELSTQLLDGDDDVRMKIIKFDSKVTNSDDITAEDKWFTTASDFQGEYKDDETYYTHLVKTVGYLQAAQDKSGRGATNWDDALSSVFRVNFREGAQKYVILVSDGDPTVYNDPNNHGTTLEDPFAGLKGNGQDGPNHRDNVKKCYDATKGDASVLVQSGYKFYTIGTYNDDIGYMEPLTSYAYSESDDGTYPTGRYQTAKDKEQLKAAFKNIVDQITKDFNYSGIKITDTLTDMTSTNLQDGYVSGQFKYTIIDNEGNTITPYPVDGNDNFYSYTVNGVTKTFKGATYNSETKQIVWEMDPNKETPFITDDGYTYNVSFTVWPNQEAYDLAADFKNSTDEKNAYESSDNDIKKQIYKKEGEETYRLRTNEEGTNADYKMEITTRKGDQTTTEYVDRDPVPITNPDGVPLNLTKIKINKFWNDNKNKDGKRPTDGITLKLYRDEDESEVATVTLKGASTADYWESEEIYISPGLAVSNLLNAGPILNVGHDYTFTEDKVDGYTLEDVTYHPMLVNSNKEMYNKNGDIIEGTLLDHLTATNNYEAEPTGSVTLKKVDSKDQSIVLTGVKFDLYQANEDWSQKETDAYKTELTTTAEGKLVISELPAGKYLLRETEPIAGYYAPEKDWRIEIKENSDKTGLEAFVYKYDPDNEDADVDVDGYVNIEESDGIFQIENSPIDYNLPSTGGFGSTPFKTAGTALMLVAVLGYIYYARDKKERRIK